MSTARTRVRERIARDLVQVSGWVAALRAGARPQEWEGGGDNTPLSEAADATQVIEERETGTQLLDWLVRRSVDLRRALQRIDDGTYGMCERCDTFIHPERLQALPEAALCLACATEAEYAHATIPRPDPAWAWATPPAPRFGGHD